MGFINGLIKVINFFMEEGAESYARTARNARVEARRTGNQANLERANETLREAEYQRESWKQNKKVMEEKLKAREQQKNIDNENEE